MIDLAALLARDPLRMRLLRVVRDLALPDAWIGAGFVRSAAWDALHDRAPTPPSGDVDVIWFDDAAAALDPALDRALDRALEARLSAIEPTSEWSVKNQARMHVRNGDAPYRSAIDAIRGWPETATAVAARLREDDAIEIAAPHGLADLLAGIVRPTARFLDEKRDVFEARVRDKRWLERWPRLRVERQAARR